MTERVGAQIKITADGSDAVRALEGVDRAAEDAGEELDRLARSGREMGRTVERGYEQAEQGAREYSRATRAAEAATTKLTDSAREFALGFVTVQGALMLARTAAASVASSFRVLAEASEETARRQALVAGETERLSRAFANALIGARQMDVILSRAEHTAGRLADTLEDDADGVGFVGEQIGGLLVVADGLISAFDALGAGSRAVSSGFGLLSDDAADLVNRVLNLSQAFSGPTGFVVAATEGLQIANELGPVTKDLGDSLDKIAGAGGVAGSVITDFFDRTAGGAVRAIPAINDLIARIEAVTGIDLDGGATEAPEAPSAPSYTPPGPDVETGIERQERYNAAILAVMQRGQADAEAEVAAYNDRIEALDEQARERRAERIGELADLFRSFADDVRVEAQATTDAVNEAYQARVDAAQGYAAGVAGALVQVTQGSATALDAIKSLIGQELVTKGTARLLEASAMFFVPGMQASAAGLAGAATAMIVAGSALSKTAQATGGSAAAAGAAPIAAAPPPQSRTDITQINNFGVVGDPRQAARMVHGDLREIAERDGVV